MTGSQPRFAVGDTVVLRDDPRQNVWVVVGVKPYGTYRIRKHGRNVSNHFTEANALPDHLRKK